MAALFEPDVDEPLRGRVDGADFEHAAFADLAFAEVKDQLAQLGSKARLRHLTSYQTQLSAMKTAEIAAITAERGERAAKRALKDGKTSKSSIAKAAKRADAAAKNADLIDKMAAGELSEEQLDVIAETAAKTDGEAAVNTAFIDKVAATDPDQAQSVADDFVADRATKDGVQSEHERQRALRRASKYHSKKSGLDTISLQGDGIATKNMWDKIKARAEELYRADGGRDVASGNHPRTFEQRLFDAAYELLCGVTTSPTGTTHQPRSGATPRGSGPPIAVIALTLDKYLGRDPAAMAEQVGLGLIPDSVLAEYLADAQIIAALYDHTGNPLWLHRTKRHATLMQRYALIARDKACVLCGADHQHCDAHHTMPWTAPAKGGTNLDNLVLLCGPCHRQLHANNETAYQDRGGTWRCRPATSDETPAPRPDRTSRQSNGRGHGGRNYPQQE